MTFIYITENNFECYAVTFQNNGWIKVQKFKDGSLDKNIIYTFNLVKKFLGKSESSAMKALSGFLIRSVLMGILFYLK